MKPLTLEEAEYVGFELAQKLMHFDEPIPPFETRYSGVLEGCLISPFQKFGGVTLHRGFMRKAAILFYGIIKDHPFMNGNKRMAVMLTLVFLHKSNKWIDVSPEDLYKLACDVAESKPTERETILDSLTMFFEKNKTTL